MFTAQSIAVVTSPIASMEFVGKVSAAKINCLKFPDFPMRLGKPYQADQTTYHFRLALNPEINIERLDIAVTKELLLSLFEELIVHPTVVSTYGRLILSELTTRAKIRFKFGALVFGDRAVNRRAPTMVIQEPAYL